MQASINTYAPFLIALPARLFILKSHIGQVQRLDQVKDRSPQALAWKEFLADFLLWLLMGVGSGLFYILYYQAPILTAVKVLAGCFSFGLFGGMQCFLAMEKRTMDFLIQKRIEITFSPKRYFSVSKKMFFFMVLVMVFMVLIILLMVFMDINYLLMHKDLFGPEIYGGVFKEIFFSFSVLLILSLVTFGRYFRNLQTILNHQLRVMEKISNGDYETKIPVMSNDEFGLIAAKTNEMINGLKERDACQVSFGRYVTPEVSEKILRGEIAPEGEMSDVTLLFCDLRGYTPFVERNRPKEVVKFLNTYFTEMEQAIKRHNGIVLQYIGDEIMAVFGAPIHEPDHPDRAVSAALEMRTRLAELNRKRESRGEPPVLHGIGIHSGEVLAGEVGSPDRLVYAMVGDAVNIAARLQSLNKQFHTDILLSETTRTLIKGDHFNMRSLGRTPLKGISGEIEVFQIL